MDTLEKIGNVLVAFDCEYYLTDDIHNQVMEIINDNDSQPIDVYNELSELIGDNIQDIKTYSNAPDNYVMSLYLHAANMLIIESNSSEETKH